MITFTQITRPNSLKSPDQIHLGHLITFTQITRPNLLDQQIHLYYLAKYCRYLPFHLLCTVLTSYTTSVLLLFPYLYKALYSYKELDVYRNS
jgi:hypothetical protein